MKLSIYYSFRKSFGFFLLQIWPRGNWSVRAKCSVGRPMETDMQLEVPPKVKVFWGEYCMITCQQASSAHWTYCPLWNMWGNWGISETCRGWLYCGKNFLGAYKRYYGSEIALPSPGVMGEWSFVGYFGCWGIDGVTVIHGRVRDTAFDLWQLLHPQKEQRPKALPRWRLLSGGIGKMVWPLYGCADHESFGLQGWLHSGKEVYMELQK